MYVYIYIYIYINTCMYVCASLVLGEFVLSPPETWLPAIRDFVPNTGLIPALKSS